LCPHLVHTRRNKFYKGDGYKFVPFSFAALAEKEKDE
jgi:hypothetical protein